MAFVYFNENRRRWGWWAAVYISLMGQAYKSFGLYLCRVYTRPILCAAVTLPPEGYTLRRLTAEDLYHAAQDPELEMPLTFVTGVIAREEAGFGVFQDDMLVAYVWRARGVAQHDDGLWARADARYRFGYKAFTRPAWRGKGLAVVVARYSDRMQQHEFSEHISFVETHNFASITATHKKHPDLTQIGLAGYFSLLGRVITFRTPGCKQAGFEF